MKRFGKINIFVLLAVLLLIFSFSGCVSCTTYGYNFHFWVEGGNGEIVVSDSLHPAIRPCAGENSWCELGCPENSQMVCRHGGKRGTSTLSFTAIPDEGYQVKEWLFNGEVVEGNKTNFYTASVSHKQDYDGVICVVFEPIQ